MNKWFSQYLNIFRVIATLLVFVHHMRWDKFSGGNLSHLHYGHEAVILFFIMSGYIIPYAYDHVDKSPARFIWKRLARFWSVLLPTLALTIVLDGIGSRLSPLLYEGKGGFVQNILDLHWFVFFQNQQWATSINFSINIVLWSLAYEFWFYVLFVCWKVRGSMFTRCVCFLIVATLVGYKILMAFPLWLMGAWLYYQREKIQVGKAVAILAIVLSVALFFVLKYIPFTQKLEHASLFGLPMHFSDMLLYDYLLGAVVVLHLGGVWALSLHLDQPKERWSGWIGIFSNTSFTTYCLHLPFMYFYMAVFKLSSENWVHIALLALITLGSTVGLGHLIEDRRKWLFHFFEQTFLDSPPRIKTHI